MAESNGNGTWKTTGTSTRILWGASVMSIVLTVATWICAVPLEVASVQQSLAAVVMLIGAPAGLAITQYQISKLQNHRHARYLENGNGHGMPKTPAPPRAPEPPAIPGGDSTEDEEGG